MTPLLLIGLLLAYVGLIKFVERRKTRREHLSLSITPDAGMLSEEKESNAATLALFRDMIGKEKAIKPEKIIEILSVISPHIRPFGRVDIDHIFKNDEVISLEEKRRLGLNTRAKYSRRLLSFFNTEALGGAHPLEILQRAMYDAANRILRKTELARCRKFDVRAVNIRMMYPCPAIRRLRKRWPIDSAPELPLPNCDKQRAGDFCVCWYEGIIEPQD